MITSTSNERVKSVKRLHRAKGRREAGLTLVEGPNGLEALASGQHRPSAIFALDNDDAAAEYAASVGVDLTTVSDSVMRAMSDVKEPVGPVVVIEIPALRSVRNANTVALVDIADPGNVGTIVRTAAGLGRDICLYGSCADPFSPKAIRASAGTALQAYVSGGTDPLADAAAQGLATVAMVVDGDDVPDLGGAKFMLVVGSEAHGLPSAISEGADHRWTVPLERGVESLNVAAAAAIGMYALG